MQRPPVDIEFHKISYSVSEGRLKGTKTILKGISGNFQSSQLSSIMVISNEVLQLRCLLQFDSIASGPVGRG
jgi:hypothetical protein